MTSTKGKSLFEVGADDDDFGDDDSGSDFDDDEDPDKIEVPGGGRDLETAVTYAKNIQRTVTPSSSTPALRLLSSISPAAATTTKAASTATITIRAPTPATPGRPSTSGLTSVSLLKINQPRGATPVSIKPTSIKVIGSGGVPILKGGPTINYNNNMPKKMNNLTAAATANATSSSSTLSSMHSLNTPASLPSSSSLPLPLTPTLSSTVTPSSTSSAAAANAAAAAAIASLTGMGGGNVGMLGMGSSNISGASGYLNSLSTNELMSLAAYVAAKGQGVGPAPSTLTTALAAVSSGSASNNSSGSNSGSGNGNGGGSGGVGYYQTNANFNMAASLLAQMGMSGYGSGISSGGFAISGGNMNTVSAAPRPSASMAATGAGSKVNTHVLEKLQSLIAANPEYLTSGIPNHVLSQLFLTQMKPPAQTTMQSNATHPPPQEEDEADYEEMGVAETYAEYWPAKLKLGKKHPDPVVETASLSSVEPSDVYFKLSIPAETINSGQLSALQLESITYASQAHDHLLPDGSRAGFLIGDGAGVGKGRTIAGIIYENYLKGRKKALWISVSNDLKYDAERDLSDIGAGKIEVHALNKFKYAKISSDTNNNCKRGVIFSTYSALIGESNNKTGKYRSRFRQLLQWCGDDFEGLIVFDECHKAKNLCPVGSGKSTKTGQTVLELQKKLPKARVVYASATGASEPKNMAYMVRLGLWGQGTAFNTFNDFIMAVEKRGVGAMEVVAMDMKLRGMYIARQLSFKGVTFKIEEVPLTKEFRRIYDESVSLWVEAMQKFTEAAELIDAESRMKKTMWGQFWSSHQRFFKYLCIAAKVNHAVKVAREAIKYGKCVVIGLQSTGEARTLEQLEKDDGELSDFVSTAKGVFQSFVERHFPAPDRSRINRILGLYETYDEHIKDDFSSYGGGNHNNNNNTASGGSGGSGGAAGGGGTINNHKRKSGRNTDLSAKKSRSNSWQDDSDNEAGAGGGGNDDEDKDDEPNDSDFKLSDSETDMSDGGSIASDASSDFNPFFSGSDSDIDPWVNARAKKTKKKKKTKERSKEPTATATSNTNNNNNNNNNTNTTATATNSSSTSSSSTSNMLKSAKKTPQSTQDKIQNLLQKKQELKGTVTQIGVNGIKMNYGPPPKDAIERACSMKEELLRKIEKLGSRLPPNTLDQLIDELGGPENVAEMTGRRGRVVQSDDGSIQYESRSEQDVPLETLNITEKQRFMDGEKDVAIISEAASSGISLQSDRRVYNQRRRVHITLELPWSADRAIQQFGRTHRSNQVNAPEYIFLISDLAGERRFASTVAKRLESLGALTHGDRRATETRDLSQFNIDNKYGRTALETVMKTIMGYEAPLVPPPTDYSGEFFKDIAGALVGVGIIVNSESNPGVLSLDKDYNNISKFLNRILGCPVELQNRLFKYFTDTMTAIINQAKRGGRFDLGIVDLGAAGENVTRVKLIRFVRKHATGVAPTELHTVRVERGMIWQEAINKYADLISDHDGFYVSHQVRNNKRTAILAVEIEASAQQQPTTQHDGKNKKEKTKSKKDIMCKIYRPNTGLQVRHESLAEIEKKYKRVSSDEAEKHWTEQYDSSVQTCSHAYWNGNCRNVAAGNDCEVGLRQRLYYVLSGSVLSVWSRVERILSLRNANNKMQVIRMKTTEGEKIVGTLIPKSSYEMLVQDLQSDSEKMETMHF